MEGRLKSTEEAELIRETMKAVDKNLDSFKGIEIATFYYKENLDLMKKIKANIAKWLVGDRNGLTIIGPATIISELKQHPEKIEMHFQKGFFEKNKKGGKNAA